MPQKYKYILFFLCFKMHFVTCCSYIFILFNKKNRKELFFSCCPYEE